MPVLESLSSSSSGSTPGGGVPDVASSVRVHGTITNVGPDSETSVLSITNGGPGTLRLDAIRVQGNIDALVNVYMDAVLKDQRRISISTPSVDFLYPRPQLIEVTKSVEIKIEHYDPGGLAEFGASIMGHRV